MPGFREQLTDAGPRAALPGALMCCFAIVSCGGGNSGGADSGRDAGDGAGCESDADCSDDSFCNGAERCMPEAAGADARGCVPAAAEPCGDEQECDEELDECTTVCGREPDGDGDGHDAVECGGDDCDDSDPQRFPGNTEVCDPDDRDEDCDPTTYGSRDEDGDSFVDRACCNVAPDGSEACGADCDDSRRGVNPDNPEVCNGLDDDCDGELDESGDPVEWYPDGDGDLFGDGSATPVVSCARPGLGFVPNGRDCDDANASINPANPEVEGNGRDDNCNGRVDEGATTLVEGGISTLGGTVTRSDARLSRGRVETFARVCRADACLTGGVVP